MGHPLGMARDTKQKNLALDAENLEAFERFCRDRGQFASAAVDTMIHAWMGMTAAQREAHGIRYSAWLRGEAPPDEAGGRDLVDEAGALEGRSSARG